MSSSRKRSCGPSAGITAATATAAAPASSSSSVANAPPRPQSPAQGAGREGHNNNGVNNNNSNNTNANGNTNLNQEGGSKKKIMEQGKTRIKNEKNRLDISSSIFRLGIFSRPFEVVGSERGGGGDHRQGRRDHRRAPEAGRRQG